MDTNNVVALEARTGEYPLNMCRYHVDIVERMVTAIRVTNNGNSGDGPGGSFLSGHLILCNNVVPLLLLLGVLSPPRGNFFPGTNNGETFSWGVASLKELNGAAFFGDA
jgi:hypothetical protein